MHDPRRGSDREALDRLLDEAAPARAVALLGSDASALARSAIAAAARPPRRRRLPLLLSAAGVLAVTVAGAVAASLTFDVGGVEPTAAASFERSADGVVEQCEGAVWVLPSTTVRTVEDPVDGWQHVPGDRVELGMEVGDEQTTSSSFAIDTLLGGDRLPVAPLAFEQAELDAVRALIAALPVAELLAADLQRDPADGPPRSGIVDAVVAAGLGDTESVRLVVMAGCVRR